MVDATQENSAPSPEALAKAEADALAAKAAADAKAVSDALHAEIAVIAAELDRLKTRLADAANKVITEPTFQGYAKAFVNDCRHKIAEIHDWMGRHGI